MENCRQWLGYIRKPSKLGLRVHCGVRVECEDLAILLDFNRKVDICTTFKTVFKSLFE
jgi:hypothetical protein